MTKENRPRLGRGFQSLISQPKTETTHTGKNILQLNPAHIVLRPDQPRKHFDEDKIEELAQSIKRHGLLEPIVVRATTHGTYELIAGERRYRAILHLGFDTIDAITHDIVDQNVLEVQLVENLQREDLNPIEIAEALQILKDQCGLKDEDIAERLGMIYSRSNITNKRNLLKLPQEVRQLVAEGLLHEGAARALNALSDPLSQIQYAKRIVRENLSVRQVEKLIHPTQPERKKKPSPKKDVHARAMEERLTKHVGGKVEVEDHNGRGMIRFYFNSYDDVQRILAAIGLEEE